MTPVQPRKGNLLLAQPNIMLDDVFARTVILLSRHNEDGTVGFTMNKPTDYTLSDFVDGITVVHSVYDGGPLEQDSLYFVHRVPDLIERSTPISDGLYWGGDFDSVQSHLNAGRISQDDIRFFLGYSGWEYSQLDQEIYEDTWLVIENKDAEALLRTAPMTHWKMQMRNLGGEFSLWSNAPVNPVLN